MRTFNVNAATSGVDVSHEIGGDEIAARLYTLDDGGKQHAYHFHHGVEEWLYVVSGSPTVRTPDGEHRLERGDVLCFPAGPDGAHEVSGPGSVLVIAENREPDIVEYPESGTIKILPSGKTFRSDQ